MGLIAEQIGSRIRALRGEEPQKDFAERAGVSAVQISRYERGVTVPTDDVLEKIVAALGCEIPDILGDRLDGSPQLSTRGLSGMDSNVPSLKYLIPARLKIFRGSKTPSEVADLAEIDLDEYKKYESGETIPNNDALGKIAKALKRGPYQFKRNLRPLQAYGLPHANLLGRAMGHRLAVLRGNKNIEDVAVESTIPEKTYKAFEDGRYLPDDHFLPLLAHGLGCSVGDIVGDPIIKNPEILSDKKFVLIPLCDMQFVSGRGRGKENSITPKNRQLFDISWVNGGEDLNKEDLLLVTVVGDAMIPTLNQGDLVLVDRSKAHVPDDGLYVLDTDGALLVKRLRKRPGRRAQVLCDNEVYGSFDLDLASPPEEMSVVGRVVWTGRKA